MIVWLAITIGVLFGSGVYLILRRSAIRLVFGLVLITNAANHDPYGIDVLFMYMANMGWNSAMNVPGTIAFTVWNDGNFPAWSCYVEVYEGPGGYSSPLSAYELRGRAIVTLHPGERREVSLPWVRRQTTGRVVGIVHDPLLDPLEVHPHLGRTGPISRLLFVLRRILRHFLVTPQLERGPLVRAEHRQVGAVARGGGDATGVRPPGRAAELAVALWERHTGEAVDGVLALDAVALGHLLGAVGPVTEPTGIVLDQANVVDELLLETYRRHPVPEDADAFHAGVTGVVLDGLLASDGILDARTAGLNGQIEGFNDQREALGERLASLETRLLRQFNAMDNLLWQLSVTSNFLTEQLANLPKVSAANRRN